MPGTILKTASNSAHRGASSNSSTTPSPSTSFTGSEVSDHGRGQDTNGISYSSRGGTAGDAQGSPSGGAYNKNLDNAGHNGNAPVANGGPTGSTSTTTSDELVNTRPGEDDTTRNVQTANGGTAGSAVQEILGLANPGSGYPPATEAIKYLLHAVGRDVVSFRRNTHVSYMVVERARDLVNSINKYIDKVEKCSDPDWESFMKFTAAIEPLEE
jgi:hypothetical protein